MISETEQMKWRKSGLFLSTSVFFLIQVAQAAPGPTSHQASAKFKYNSTSNLLRNRHNAGFVHLPTRQNTIDKAKLTTSRFTLPMTACSRQLRLDSIENNSNSRARADKSLKTYSIHNHPQTSSVVMRQSLHDSDTKESSIQRHRGGAKRSSAEDMTLTSSRVADIELSRNNLLERVRYKFSQVDVQDAAVIAAYSCTQFALSLPVILIPMIAADPFLPGVENTVNSAAFLGTLVSLSNLGAGVGKFFNGFICQAIGGRMSGYIYLLGLAFSSVVLSTTYTLHGYAIAGMEFSASMMWTASSVLMAERYSSDPKKFAAGITSLSLASTAGTLTAKVVGGAFLSQFHWRQVCLLSTIVATVGSALLFFVRDEVVLEKGAASADRVTEIPKRSAPSLQSIRSTVSRVLGNRTFYAIAFAHLGSFIIRSSDKVVGAFLADTTDLPRFLCGTLTTSITLGFVLGLISGRKFEDLENTAGKKQFLLQRYSGAVLSAVAIAALANRDLGGMLGQYGYAAAITILTGIVAALVGYQFYQLPPKYATSFGQDKAVYISLNDGICFLALSSFWPTITGIAARSETGWSQAWLIVAAFVAAGGAIMTNSLDKVLEAENNSKESE